MSTLYALTGAAIAPWAAPAPASPALASPPPSALAPLADWPPGDESAWAVSLPWTGWVLTGRAVFLAAAALTILLVAGIGVAASGRPELRRRWTTWAVIIPAVGIPIWMGRGTTALLAALLALQAVRELARLPACPGPRRRSWRSWRWPIR